MAFIDFDLPRPSMVAGGVLKHCIAVMERTFTRLDPLIFKVGWTHNPVWRWSNKLYGYGNAREKWSNMVVLYVTHEPHGPAMLEAALIEKFKGTWVWKNLRFHLCCSIDTPAMKKTIYTLYSLWEWKMEVWKKAMGRVAAFTSKVNVGAKTFALGVTLWALKKWMDLTCAILCIDRLSLNRSDLCKEKAKWDKLSLSEASALEAYLVHACTYEGAASVNRGLRCNAWKITRTFALPAQFSGLLFWKQGRLFWKQQRNSSKPQKCLPSFPSAFTNKWLVLTIVAGSWGLFLQVGHTGSPGNREWHWARSCFKKRWFDFPQQMYSVTQWKRCGTSY